MSQRNLLSALFALLLAPLPGGALAEPATFDSPEAAVAAVIAAIEAQDGAALLSVFGTENEDVVFTGDPEKDRENWGSFYRDYSVGNWIEIVDDVHAVLHVGRENWPFPAEIVLAGGKWGFDGAGAREEVLMRRIGLNELDVIALVKRAHEVQTEYRQVDYDADGVMEFAQGILSSENGRDGLYWPDAPGAPVSPIGDFLARAAADGYNLDGSDQQPDPYLGYYFRILQKQGPAAPGGAYDYVINGNMVAGHALLAYPAAYGETGIMSFLVGEAGVVYQADLGADTLDLAGTIESFDPNEGWSPVE